MHIGFDLKDEFKPYQGSKLRKPEEIILNTHMELLRPVMKKNMIALDAGCGLGQLSKPLSEQVRLVVSIDVSHYNVKEAKRINYERNIEYIVGDVSNLSFRPEAFDIVVSSEVIEHVPNYQRMIEEIVIVGKKGCHYSLSTPNLVIWLLYPTYWAYIIKHPRKSINIMRNRLINREFIDIWLSPFTLTKALQARGLKILHFTTRVLLEKNTWTKNKNKRLGEVILSLLDANSTIVYKKIPIINKYIGLRQFILFKKIRKKV